MNFFRCEPGAGFDFLGMKLKGPFVFAAIHPHKFLPRFFASINAQDAGGSAGEVDAEFLMHFAESARIVILAAIDVPGSGGIPNAGVVVLFVRAFLEEEFSPGIEDEDVNGAVFQSLAVNFAAGKLANNLVAIVYNIENFVLHALA